MTTWLALIGIRGRWCSSIDTFSSSIAQQREQAAAIAKLFGNKPVQ